MNTPVFNKRENRPYDYQEMTWSKFIKLREWGKITANKIGYSVYLVGSALHKEFPRDIDIVIIIPLNEYEKMFVQLTETNWSEILAKAFNYYVNLYFECEDILGESGLVPLDFKIYPENWFVNEDRILLGEPNIKDYFKREDERKHIYESKYKTGLPKSDKWR